MQPLKTLAVVPKDTPSPAAWYFEGGGLRRRLHLLGPERRRSGSSSWQGARLLRSHLRTTSLFPRAGDANEVRFIDADNIHYASIAGVPALFTPGYGAPELVRCLGGVNSLTDAHAFAVLAFQTLSLVHPLIGDDIANGSSRARGRSTGRSTALDRRPDRRQQSFTSCGIPRTRYCHPGCSTIAGRLSARAPRRRKRPGVPEWAERLHAAADATLLCSSCKGTFYFTAKQCPWCNEPRPPFATAAFNLWDPSLGPGAELLQKPAGAGAARRSLGPGADRWGDRCR